MYHTMNASYDDVDWQSAAATFPQKLYALSVHEFEREESSVVWCAQGTAFKVRDPEAFEKNVLNKYFKHSKVTSFQRQLNLYGFRRITKGDDFGAYFHSSFLRGRDDLISEIRRFPANKTYLTQRSEAHEYQPSSSSSSSKRTATLRSGSRQFDYHAPAEVTASSSLSSSTTSLMEPPNKKVKSYSPDQPEVIASMSSLTKRFFCPAKILAGQHALAQSSGEDHGQEQTSSMYLNVNNRKSIDDFKMILQSVSQYDEMVSNGTTDKQSSKSTTESNEELDYSIFDDERSWREDMCRIQ